MLKVKSQKYILGLYAASLLVMPTKNVVSLEFSFNPYFSYFLVTYVCHFLGLSHFK